MTNFNPYWGGLDYVVNDSQPPDSFAISFFPSIASDAAAGVLQADSEMSTQQFMQSQFRASTENMYDSGLVVSSYV